ncbi:MAG: hypothetical protein KF858_05695 [Candidatus Sumerlaeia bacterium]|nr:hypothetical protein [Candidatus Sumerlaeia bacterium]
MTTEDQDGQANPARPSAAPAKRRRRETGAARDRLHRRVRVDRIRAQAGNYSIGGWVLVAFAIGALMVNVGVALLLAVWATVAFGISAILRALCDVADAPDAGPAVLTSELSSERDR